MKSRIQMVVALGIGGIGLIVAAVLGLFAYMSLTATPLHPIAQDVPSEPGAPPAKEWTDAVDRARQVVRATVTEQNLPGLSVAVGTGGDVLWAEGFGWTNLEQHLPVTAKTKFRIGTASVVLTSAAAGLLLESGKLKLDDEIQTYVPEFPKKDSPVTLRQLMAHTAGVRNDGGDEGPLFTEHCERPGEAFRFFADRPLLFQPGTRYRYSSYGWIVVSAAVEAAAGERLFRFMRTAIFEPLGMSDTRPDSTTGEMSDRAIPYFPKFSADPRYGPDPMRDIDLSCYSGASALLSTPSDLVRFGMAVNEGKLLKRDTVQVLQTSQRLPSGEETGYGLGWDLEPAALAGQQTRVVGHDGDVLGGMVASLMTFPERGFVVAAISNTSYADTFAIAVKIADAFAEQRKTSERK